MTVGLLITSVVLGLRHGVDWDHIAAITDLTTSSETRRRGFALSMLYAIGHALVVLALGATAIVAGASIPAGADRWTGRIVGATLIALGCWILIELIRKRRDFRLRSRWMLIINGTFAGIRRVRSGRSHRHIVVDHQHDHDHDVDVVPGAEAHLTASAHDHAHLTGASMASPVELPAAAAVGGSAAPAEPADPFRSGQPRRRGSTDLATRTSASPSAGAS
jgi:ABC-type nickel/cobalt efflux system permease component RcnA